MKLQVRDASVVLGGRPVLNAVDLDIVPGEILALVGPNGAGKSTLLGLLAGDFGPTAGSVRLDDRAMAAWRPGPLARRRAVLPQEPRLAFGFRVVDVVRMGRAPWAGYDEDLRDDELVDSAMTLTDVRHLAARSFPTLSGGEKARTSLARVLAQDTAMLLLDEPTAALDLRHSELVLIAARELAQAGHAVVVVVHDLTTAGAYADRICVMDDGRIRAIGTPWEVLTPELLLDVYGYPVDVLEHDDRPVVIARRRASSHDKEELACAQPH